MNINDLPLTNIFWGIFGVEAMIVAFMLLMVVIAMINYKPSDGGLVGAWLVLIPIVALAIVAGLFLAFKAPWFRFVCIMLLLFPLISPLVGVPIQAARRLIGGRLKEKEHERYRRGEHLFREAGPRTLAAAIADRDVERIKAALPGAGDLNRLRPTNLPYYVPWGNSETFLTFALKEADDSNACAEVIRLLLAAGSSPNMPPGAPLARALSRSKSVTKLLLEAGANINEEDGPDRVVWWCVLGEGGGGNPDVSVLQMLLDNGADTTKLTSSGRGPITFAVECERWDEVLILARRIPGAKDVVVGRNLGMNREGETVHALLARKVKALRESNGPIPEDMIAALAFLDAA